MSKQQVQKFIITRNDDDLNEQCSGTATYHCKHEHLIARLKEAEGLLLRILKAEDECIEEATFAKDIRRYFGSENIGGYP